MVISPKDSRISVDEIVNGSEANRIAYKYDEASNISFLSNIWFEDEIDKIYQYVQSHLVQDSYQIDVLKNIITANTDVITPDVLPNAEMRLTVTELNSYKALIPRIKGKTVNNGYPTPKGDVAMALKLQNIQMLNLLSNYIVALFSNDKDNGKTYNILSTYIFDANLLTIQALENYDSENDVYLTVKSELSSRLLLNTIPIMDSAYSLGRRPTIVTSSYVINRLNELIAFLSKVKIFNYNVFFKKTSYSGKIIIDSFFTTSDVQVKASYKSDGTLKGYGIGSTLFVKWNVILTPYARYYDESLCGVKSLFTQNLSYSLQKTDAVDKIELLDDIKFIYTTDNTSDVPTFDFSTLFGSNGNFALYKTILTEESNLASKIDLSMFDISEGKFIQAYSVKAAIDYIFRMWIENIKTYYYTLYICHSNCHNNNILVDMSDAKAIDILYMQCNDYSDDEINNSIFTAINNLENPSNFTVSYPSSINLKILGTLDRNLTFAKLNGLDYLKCNKIKVARSTPYVNLSQYDAKVRDLLSIYTDSTAGSSAKFGVTFVKYRIYNYDNTVDPPTKLNFIDETSYEEVYATNEDAAWLQVKSTYHIVDVNDIPAALRFPDETQELAPKCLSCVRLTDVTIPTRINCYRTTTVNTFDGALTIELKDDCYTIKAPEHPVSHAIPPFNDSNRNTTTLNAVLAANTNTLYCLLNLDKLLVKYVIEPKVYKYKIIYLKKDGNNDYLNIAYITRTFTADENSTHMYYWCSGHLDGRCRPCMYVSISEIDPTYTLSMTKITVQRMNSSNVLVGDLETPFNSETGKFSPTQATSKGTYSPDNNTTIVRAYREDGPGTHSIDAIHDESRFQTEWTYIIKGKEKHPTTLHYVPLLDYFSKNSCFYTCSGLYKLSTKNNLIPAELAPCKKCCRPKPYTTKYAILPLNLKALKYIEESDTIIVNVYCQ